MPIISDLHVHSFYSQDSLLSPRTIIRIAEKRGISILAVTDHNTLKGGIETARIARESCSNLLVIPGIEISTNNGHVIGLLIQEEIFSRDYFEVLYQIKRQAGLVVIPHPSKKSQKFGRLDLTEADLIEGYNGRATKKENDISLCLGASIRKPLCAGSDAHSILEIGKVRQVLPIKPSNCDEFKKIILANSSFTLEKSKPPNPYLTHMLSFSTELFRRLL